MVMVVLTGMSRLWTEACASPGAPADEPGVQDGSQQAFGSVGAAICEPAA
jgi:hypothetical protein